MQRGVYFTICILCSLALISGCSGPPGMVTPDITPMNLSHQPLSRQWTWGHWMFHVSGSHDSIAVVPVRDASWHVNVLNFVEKSPCPSCLQIGKLVPQGDGTVKVNVWLSHPFPGQPQFTGFDVQGIAMFPATKYWG